MIRNYNVRIGDGHRLIETYKIPYAESLDVNVLRKNIAQKKFEQYGYYLEVIIEPVVIPYAFVNRQNKTIILTFAPAPKRYLNHKVDEYIKGVKQDVIDLLMEKYDLHLNIIMCEYRYENSIEYAIKVDGVEHHIVTYTDGKINPFNTIMNYERVE